MSKRYYGTVYKEQQVTDVPDDGSLSELMHSGFVGTGFDKRNRVMFIERAGAGTGRLLDYGCSWGYSTYQYIAAGHDAVGFEISEARAAVGRCKLGLEVRSNWKDIERDEPFDLIVCDHSIEHVPNLKACIARLNAVLKPGGDLFVFAPNCSGILARRLGTDWGPFIGESHTLALTIEWFIRNLPSNGFKPRFYHQNGSPILDPGFLVDDEELVLVARKNSW